MRRSGIVPVPYDFDCSGFVNAPYAVPARGPEPGQSVRDRRYRGYCMHNVQALAAAAEFRAKRAQLLAVLAAIPQLDEGRRRKAAAYLDGFFRDIATDERRDEAPAQDLHQLGSAGALRGDRGAPAPRGSQSIM